MVQVVGIEIGASHIHVQAWARHICTNWWMQSETVHEVRVEQGARHHSKK